MTDCIGFSVNTNLCFGQPSFSGLWFGGLAVNSFFPWGSQPSTRLYRLKATCIIHDICAHRSSKTSYTEGVENQNPSTVNCPFLIPVPPLLILLSADRLALVTSSLTKQSSQSVSYVGFEQLINTRKPREFLRS